MSVEANQPIALADFKALATLANTKLAPATAYAFTEFAGPDQISLPTDVVCTPTYGAGFFPDGQKISVDLYGYKTIAGVKTYTGAPLRKAFLPTAGAGSPAMQWDWVAPTGLTAPEGYVFVYIGVTRAWQDIGAVSTFSSDGTFSEPGWKFDATLDENNSGVPADNLPCGHGTWLKIFNRIRKDALKKLNAFGGATPLAAAHKVSGPTNVSISPKCYLYINTKPVYEALQFIYSEADGAGGNSLSSEADMFITYFGVDNGANNFNFSENGKLNGRILLLSDPPDQNQADWTLSATPGVIVSYVNNYADPEAVGPPFNFMGFAFDFVDFPYTVGAPIVLTATPTAGGSLYLAGSGIGGGKLIDLVFTATPTSYSTNDTFAIHLAGKAAKTVDLANTLTPITFTPPLFADIVFAAHWRSYCNGVFSAMTLPSPGIMTYLDLDLPQYKPGVSIIGLSGNGTRRISQADVSLPYIPRVQNKGTVWPIYRDLDFAPDSVAGKPLIGSKAWQGLFNKFAGSKTNTDTIPPSVAGSTFGLYSLLVLQGATELRFYLSSPHVTLYAAAGRVPSTADFDFIANVAGWNPVPAGFTSGALWFYVVQNNNVTTVINTTAAVFVIKGAPEGTLLPTLKDANGNNVAQLETDSYKFDVPSSPNNRPIPLLGYTIFGFLISRVSVDNGNGVFVKNPASADIHAQIGVMKSFGFADAGVFDAIVDVTIPIGQSSVYVPANLSVLSAVPLSYQCDEMLSVIPSVSFQPMMYSKYLPVTAPGGAVAGFYNGEAWFNQTRALLFFRSNDVTDTVVLQMSSQVFNDVESFLNTL